MNDNDLLNVKSGALGWWNSLRPNSEHGTYKGDRAELRRCHSITDVMLIPSYYRLLKKANVYAENPDPKELHPLAVIAWVLSWVDEETDTVFAKSLAEKKSGTDKPIFSEKRFRRLLASNDWDDLSVQLIRALKITKGRANVSDLIESIWYWKRGTKQKERWALSYYGNVIDEKTNKEN